VLRPVLVLRLALALLLESLSELAESV